MFAALILTSAAPVRPADDNQLAPTGLPAHNVIRMEIYALDSGGEPVTDLQSSDFQLFDDGKLQTIAYCRNNGRREPQAVALSPHEFSNRIGATPRVPTVIFLDLLNLRALGAERSGEQIVRSLDRLESTEKFYVYLLANDASLYPVRPVPKSESDLQAAAEPWTQQIGTTLDRAIGNATGRRLAEDDLAVSVKATFQALTKLADEMAGIPGRKNIVWVTSGVPSAYRSPPDGSNFCPGCARWPTGSIKTRSQYTQ